MKTNQESIRSYFENEDIRTAINTMSYQDMNDLLRSLEGTPLWIAILKYNQERIGNIQNSFLVLDPFSEQTKIARYQGVITGILDLQDAVLTLKFESQRKENKNTKEVDKDELGGAYGNV